MAKIKTSEKKLQKKFKERILNRVNLAESYTGLLLGAIVVLIIGILLVSLAKGSGNKQISFVDNLSEINGQVPQDSSASSTYTVRPGDDLWTISENIYNNGYKWIEIASINKLENPGLIYSGDKLVVPTLAPEEKLSPTPAKSELNVGQAETAIVRNNSITGSTYTVAKGDNLWNIAVRAYGDGFKWPEIAKANKLINPNIIHPGNIFKIPR